MIAIIDYGAGNIESVENALDFLKVKYKLTTKKEGIGKADKIILPGVGAFGDAMKSLEKFNLINTIKKNILDGKPYLGICLGLQALFEKSEESRGINGLEIFKGDVTKLKDRKLKIPQIGWNSIIINKKNKNNLLLKNIKNNSYFYFVHSYYVKPKDKSIILTETEYGERFVSGIAKDNIYGVQFHPERSGDIGLKLLKNFCNLK